MKKSILLILVYILTIPYLARTQNEGMKTASNQMQPEFSPSSANSANEMALMKDQGTAGGISNAGDSYYESTSFYLEPGWAQGQVVLRDHSVLDNILLRYDLYNQQLQFIKGNDTLAFSEPEEASYFLLNGKKLIYSEFKNNGEVKKGFFELLTDDNCKLMLRRIIKYHKEPDMKSTLKEDIYVRENQYFIMKPGDIASPVILSRLGVINALKDKEPQIREFIDSNKMKIKTFDELRQVVAYYNTLI